MKKVVITSVIIAVFVISSFSIAFAKSGKQSQVPEKKQTKQSEVKKQVGNVLEKKVEESLPPVIKVGELQIPTNAVIKGFKATLVWDKLNDTIIISNNDITIKFVGDSKVFVNNVEVSITSIKDGKGRLVPMGFIEQTLTGKKITTPSAIGITTPSGVTTTPSGVTTTPSGVTTTTQGINVK